MNKCECGCKNEEEHIASVQGQNDWGQHPITKEGLVVPTVLIIVAVFVSIIFALFLKILGF